MRDLSDEFVRLEKLDQFNNQQSAMNTKNKKIPINVYSNYEYCYLKISKYKFYLVYVCV